jgi:hypothetical protein
MISNPIYAQLDVTASINGMMKWNKINDLSKAQSENRIYWCTYDIKKVSDEMRTLINFKFYKHDELIFILSEVPGSDVDISNSGNIVFYDHSFHFNNKLKLHFYSKDGRKLIEKETEGANLFGFSSSGNLYGVGTPDGIQIINLTKMNVQNYPKGFQFAFSEDENLIAIASENEIKVFNNESLISTIHTGFKHTRRIVLSSVNDFIAAISKNNLKVYSLSSGFLKFSNTLGADKSYRDLKIIDNQIAAGVHYRTKTESRGEMILFDQTGNITKSIFGQEKHIEKHQSFKSSKGKNDYDIIPWPFAPFDSMRTVWNHYEQHMGGYGSSYSYLHQGLDLITPIAEPTYAVKSGIVKCVLTLGGAIYWRLAISDSNTDDRSDGWLYAHLIESTIQFDVGDTVEVHDYLGDIVEWTSEWGHIHFVEINDSGFVWLYNDDEWGINFNPLLALTPLPDTTSPVIDNVFTDQKFGFCINETSTYLQPDALSGNVDIIIKVYDYAGDSEWQQPAYKIDYWIKRIWNNDTIIPSRMAHLLNHPYPFYSGDNYEPYATVMYKRDDILTPTSWMSTERNFHHVITNSNGDSVISLEEKNLSLNTADFYDSEYRIFVEAFDQSGNPVIDSMDVYFNNGISSVENNVIPIEFALSQNYPNPFNPVTKISWQSPVAVHQTLKVYDVLGNEVAILLDEFRNAGNYEVRFEASNFSSGIYFYELRAGDFISTKKMILLK